MSLEDRIWNSAFMVQNMHITIVDNVVVLQIRSSWDENDMKDGDYNAKGLNTIFSCFTISEFQRVSTCTALKAAWEVSEITCEGTITIKHEKLQRQTTHFLPLTTKENETFDDFYVQQNYMVNLTFYLGNNDQSGYNN